MCKGVTPRSIAANSRTPKKSVRRNPSKRGRRMAEGGRGDHGLHRLRAPDRRSLSAGATPVSACSDNSGSSRKPMRRAAAGRRSSRHATYMAESSTSAREHTFCQSSTIVFAFSSPPSPPAPLPEVEGRSAIRPTRSRFDTSKTAADIRQHRHVGERERRPTPTVRLAANHRQRGHTLGTERVKDHDRQGHGNREDRPRAALPVGSAIAAETGFARRPTRRRASRRR